MSRYFNDSWLCWDQNVSKTKLACLLSGSNIFFGLNLPLRSLKVSNAVLLLFLLLHIHYKNLKQSSKIQLVKENSTPKQRINYNHDNIGWLMTDNVPVFNIFLTQATVIFSFLIKKTKLIFLFSHKHSVTFNQLVCLFKQLGNTLCLCIKSTDFKTFSMPSRVKTHTFLFHGDQFSLLVLLHKFIGLLSL